MTLNNLNLYRPRNLWNIICFQRPVRCGLSIRNRVMSMDAEMQSAAWRGVPISEIIGSQSPWGAPEFPLVTPSHNHAVLYHIPSTGDIRDRPLRPQIGQDKWDGDHVRMPCSSHSLYPVEDSDGETHLRKRWEMIEEALTRPIMNSTELADAILSYNTKFKNIWQFKTLHSLFNDHLDEDETKYFFTVTLPEIAKLALQLPKLIQAPIPLLKQHSNKSISLTQHQVASLLANSFFCTFPRRNTTKRNSEYSSYPHINFSTLYETEPYEDMLEKLKCLCHYFRRVCTKASPGVVTFARRSVAARGCPQWAHSARQVASLPVHVSSEGKIENSQGLIQLDFANKYLGGGVLGRGSVQEEIRFSICPELMVSMLFTEMLKPNEALMMLGCERYSDYIGYGHTFCWSGEHRDAAPRDASARRRVAVLAVDALPYSNRAHEYRREMITRELDKAWIGFSFYADDQPLLQYPGIATGNWGCGAFGGSPQLKSLIQLMACAQTRRPMAYYTFGDSEIRDDIINVYNLLARYNVTVGQLYRYIVRFSSTDVRRSQLHSFLHQVILDENKPPASPQSNNMISSTEIEATKKEFLNDSPDLFSQDDDQTLIETDSQIDKDTEHQCKIAKTSHETKMAETVHTMAEHTSDLFTELNKFDDENGKLNLSIKRNATSASMYQYVDKPKTEDDKMKGSNLNTDVIQNKMASSSNSPTSVKIDMNKTPNRKSLFEEMQKFDEEQGRLNLSKPNTMLLDDSKLVIPESDASMESDKIEASPEVKKKIAKKITDYFSKKST